MIELIKLERKMISAKYSGRKLLYKWYKWRYRRLKSKIWK